MGNILVLGDFAVLPGDLRNPKFVNKYLHRSDIKLLLNACYVNVRIEGVDVLHYMKHYSSGNNTINLELYKYYNFDDCIFNGDSDLSELKFLHINNAVFTNRNFPRGLKNPDVVQYICENNIALPEKCLTETIMIGDLAIMTCLHDAGYKFGYQAFLRLLECRRDKIELLIEENKYKSDLRVEFLFNHMKLQTYEGVFMMALLYADYYVIRHMIFNRLVKRNDIYYSIFYNNTHKSGYLHTKYLKSHFKVGNREFERILKMKN